MSDNCHIRMVFVYIFYDMDNLGKNCVICEENQSKYKCPTCEKPYCSVDCWKKHQQDESICQEIEKVVKSRDIVEKPIILFPTDDTIPEEKLDLLRNSEALKVLLRNSHLRRLLEELDGASNAENAMKAAMQEPLFTEFADEVLKIVEPEMKIT
ncbi:Zinc finger HIT domain-containing protein 3 [Sergentomyia squamirostris]